MIESKVDMDSGIVELTLDGSFSQDDVDAIFEQLEDFIQKKGKIKLLEDIRSCNFSDFTPSMLWKGLKFDIQHLKDISHCAVVSDKGWIGPIAKAAGGIVSCEIRAFSLDKHDEALQWLKDA